ncbi:MAG TPA: hypothetical protein VL326_03325, partial [Kofleriaceae bacterium]|nr:hypothetical protein [Kofleriaceae bacterium]
MGALASVVLWILAYPLARATTSIEEGTLAFVCFGMALVNALGFVFAIRADTMNRQQIIALTLNGLAGVAVLVLLDRSGATERLAALA